MSKPIYKINVLDIADMNNDYSFLVNKYEPGVKKPLVPTYSYLITGEGIPPILVDTGVREDGVDYLARVGLSAYPKSEKTYESQLAKFGYKKEDIGVIIHTHLHVDHAGNDYQFPQAKIIMCRKELMFSVADMMDEQYPAEYITYLAEQLHVPGRIRLIDDVAEIAPGIVLEPTEGHTWGSLNIKVNTAKGLAICCGDVIYDEILQCHQNKVFTEITAHANHPSGIELFGDRTTGNYWNLWAAKAAVQKVMREADVVLPSHDLRVVETYGTEI